MPIDPNLGYTDWYKSPNASEGSSDPGIFSWFQGFGRSAVESIPELIGWTPSTETQEWRQDHPVGSFTSQMLGMAVPYGGWFRWGVKAIKPLEEFAKGLEAGKGFTGGALATAARLAPLEAGRIVGNQLTGDQTLTQMLGETATDLALGSGIGGLIHGIGAAGLRDPKLPSIFPGLDISLPLPLMARKMREIIDSGVITDPEMQGRAVGKLKETLRDARSETLPSTQRYVGPIGDDSLASGGKASEVESNLNRWWKDTDKGSNSIISRKFAAGKQDFSDMNTWQAEAKEAGLPDGFEEHGQYFRSLSFRRLQQGVDPKTTEKTALDRSKLVNDTITKNMLSVGDGNFMAREADEGMFVMARKYQGDTSKAKSDDKWLLFKTDKPGYFLPDADKWAKYQLALSKWVPGAELVPDGGPVYNAAVGYGQNFPLRNWQAIVESKGKLKETIDSLLPQGITGKGSEAVARMGEFLNEYLTPRIWQFRGSYRASHIINNAKLTYDAGETAANEVMYGKLKVDPGAGLGFEALRNGKVTGIDGLTPVKQIIDGASKETIDQFMEKVWKPRIDPTKLDALMASGEITPETMKLGKALAQVKDWLNTTTRTVEEATGRKASEFHPGDYGLMRYFEGPTRVVVKNDAGDLVAYGAGPNRRSAFQNAQKLIDLHPDWKIDGEIPISSDPAGAAKYLKAQNTALKESQDIGGFKWDLENPTGEELIKDYEEQVRKVMKYQANLSTGDVLTPTMAKLQKENPVAYNLVQARLRDYAGIQSTFGKWQNAVADQVLAPMIGTDSASKIVGRTNTAMFDLTLGAMKLSYPVINALQAIQTVAPEVAMVLGKAVPDELAPSYSHFAAGGTKGPIGGMAVLNPVKMLYGGITEMRNPSKDLSSAFERAANERVIEPRMVEDYIGKSAVKMTDLKAAIGSKEGFVGWLRAVSEWLPAETERLSRTHAFTTGYRMARDFLQSPSGEKLSTDQMYQFAKEFTEKTMFLYNTADKSRIFTTPAGSLMGLFKNWMFHYMASMGEYTQQGFTKNNWAPLLWQLGGTMSLGGLAATPFIGAADKFSKLWSDKSTMQLAYEHFDQNADWLLYGLPALMGVSMTSSVDTPALSNPVRDGSSLFSVAAWGRAQGLSKAIGAAFDNWQATGRHPGADQATREAMVRAFAPVTMYRSLSAFANPESINSLSTGYPLVKDPSIVSRLLYASGFTPLELQRGYDISTALYENHDELKTQEAKLGKAWAEAEMDGDSQRMGLIMRQGITWGVDISRVIKNGMRELENQRKDIIERHLKPRDIGMWRRAVLGGKEEE